MRFGIFGGVQAGGRPGTPMGQGFHDFIDFNVEAEALGYHATFLVEHHFSGWNQITATLTLLTWLAARTRRLRLGTAVMTLPWHNPVILAEQAATLDLLSDGRLDFGVGKGYRYNEFTGFGVPVEEADARFAEALEVIRTAWTTDGRFSHHGRFWRYEDIIVEPPTRQKPHPPFWMAAGSAPSIKLAAERGCNLILDQFAPVETIRARIALFRAEIEARGRRFDPLEVTVAREMHVARNQTEKEAALARAQRGREQIRAVSRWPDRRGGSHILAYSDAVAELEANSLIGSVDEIAAKIEKLRAAGVAYLILICGSSPESLRRFAEEIMPAFAEPVLSCPP